MSKEKIVGVAGPTDGILTTFTPGEGHKKYNSLAEILKANPRSTVLVVSEMFDSHPERNECIALAAKLKIKLLETPYRTIENQRRMMA